MIFKTQTTKTFAITTASILGACLALIPLPTNACAQRSHAAKAAFQRSHPCPSTGLPRGNCKGYVVDHIKPLACGGDDAPINMQWQTRHEAKLKDKWERKQCNRQ